MRRREFGPDDVTAFPQDFDRNQSGGLLEHQTAGKVIVRCDDVGGADIRMAGEWKLRQWREDPNVRSMGEILRRKDERGLGVVELPRDRLHRAGVQSLRVQHDGEGVAAKRLVGENIDRHVAPHGHKLLGPVSPS